MYVALYLRLSSSEKLQICGVGGQSLEAGMVLQNYLNWELEGQASISFIIYHY